MDVLTDTNVILRRIHRAHPQHRQARQAIQQLAVAGNRIYVTSQNLIECWAVCTRPVVNNGLGLTPNQASAVLGKVETSVFRLPDSDDIYAEWRRLVEVHGVSGKKVHDARLVAAMIVNSIARILTFNADDFSRFAGIVVINPAQL